MMFVLAALIRNWPVSEFGTYLDSLAFVSPEPRFKKTTFNIITKVNDKFHAHSHNCNPNSN